MAIITALSRAKTYLMLPDDDGVLEAKVDNALAPATADFEQKPWGYRYSRTKLVTDTFNSVSVSQISDDWVEVTVAHSVIKRLWNNYELKVPSGNYQDTYFIKAVDKQAKTFQIEAEFFDETITFENAERQVYEDALAWYVCAYTRYTLQELHASNPLLTSSQLGEGNINSFNVSSVNAFKNELIKNAHAVLGYRAYTTGH
jgi:hypothetical protein